MRRTLLLVGLVAIALLLPIAFLSCCWPHLGSPTGFNAFLTVLLCYAGWVAVLAGLSQICGLSLLDLFKKPTQPIGPATPEVAREPTSALHSLPAPPADFVGRISQADELVEQLTDGKGAAISGLAGMGGVGKTALGLSVAHRIADRYPDAQVFLDMKGTTKAPLSPADAMRQVIQAFVPQADLRETSEDQIARLYTSTLAGKHALLFMDNAADAGQVKPLVPPATCALLVTSRTYFVLPGLTPLRLDVMGEEDARRLLLRLCKRTGPQADEIARLCGWLPLALRIAGKTLAEHVDLSPAEYVTQLTDRRQRLEVLKSKDDPDLDVAAAFDLTYELLPSDAQARWRGLAVFPAAFDSAAAAEVWALEVKQAAGLLSDFVRASLVDYDKASGRYSLHDLLADFANARLTETERKTAQTRHAQHFLKVARHASRLYLQGGDGVLKGLALFDAEWPHIRAGQAWADADWAASEEAARLCNDYPDVAVYCLALRLDRRDHIAWLESAIAAARKLGDRGAEGNHLGNLGNAYLALGDAGKAIEYYEQALKIARETGDRSGEGNALGNLGLAYADLGDARKAIGYYEQALEIAREIGDRRGEGNALGNMGVAYKVLGDARKAIEYYEQALEIDREIGDRRGEGSDLGNLGNAYLELGDARKSIEYYKEWLDIAREIGDRRGEGNALGNLGNAYADLGDTRKAIECYQQQLVIVREIGDRQGECAALGNLGDEWRKLGENDKARACLEDGLRLALNASDPRQTTYCAWQLADLHEDIGELGTAVALNAFAFARFRDMGYTQAQAAADNLAGHRKAMGDGPFREALATAEQTVASIFRNLAGEQGADMARGLSVSPDDLAK